MAKQYIPGVSGLLTEPNPVDAPSNTLSEAENVIVEQGGKVQARHGLNVTEIESDALTYNDINAISSVSIVGGKGGGSLKPSRLIDYSGFNVLEVDTSTGSHQFKPGTFTNLTSANIGGGITNPKAPYGYGNVIGYTALSYKDYFDASPAGSDRSVELFPALNTIIDNNYASGTWVYNGTNDAKIACLTFFISREKGSSRFTLQIGQSFADTAATAYDKRLELELDFDSQSIVSVNSVNGPSPEHIESKFTLFEGRPIKSWYKISVRFRVTPEIQSGTAGAKLSARIIYRNGSYSDALCFGLSGNPTAIYSSRVPGTNSTRLNFNDYLATYALSGGQPRMFVGDLIQFSFAPTGLTSGKLYRISEINLASNYIVIEHPGETSTGTTSGSFIAGTIYGLAYPTLKIDYTNNDSEYLTSPTSTTNIPITSITTGATTQIFTNTSTYNANAESYVKFVKINESLPAVLPSGLILEQPYKILYRTSTADSSSIYTRYLDVSTSGSNTFSNVELAVVADVFYVTYSSTNTNSQLAKTSSEVVPWYAYASQYSLDLTTFKLLKYKDSSNVSKTIMFVNQNAVSYAANQTGIFKVNRTNVNGVAISDTDYIANPNINRYYLIEDSGNLGNYEALNYTTVNNAFATKESIYLQTEKGISESNVDNIESDVSNKFFDVKWPAYPDMSYKLKTSDIVANWLTAGTKCAVRMTFYREMGYTDKPGIIYESEPSVPIVITSLFKNTIPEFYIDFRTNLTSDFNYQTYNEFIKASAGRKFGIRLYRTISVDIDDDLPTEYFQCYADLPFDNFMGSTIYYGDRTYDSESINNNNYYFVLRDSRKTYNSKYGTSSSNKGVIETNVNKIDMELNIGDIVHVAYDDTQVSTSYRTTSVDLPIKYPYTGTISIADNTILVPENPFVAGDVVYFDATSLPTPLAIKTPYYVISVTTSGGSVYLKVSTSPNGSEVDFTTTGTGLQIFSPKYTDSSWPSINAPTVNYPIIPSKYNTTDSSILKEDYRPARLKVIAKRPLKLATPDYYNNQWPGSTVANDAEFEFYGYKFQAVESIFNTRGFVDGPLTLSNYYIPAGTTIEANQFLRLCSIFLTSGYDSEFNKILLMRSFIASLEINDSGIKSLPQLYTNINSDGEQNSNIVIPRAANSIKYKDFQVYHGIKKSLTASLFVTRQPRTEQVYFHHLNSSASSWSSPSGAPNVQPPGNIFYLPAQNSSLPVVGSVTSGQTVNGGRLFMDAPFCGPKDVEILKFNTSNTTVGNATANRLEVASQSIINPIITLADGTGSDTANQNLLNTYRFNATIYEQASITLKLDNNEVTIKTYPIYNRRGYYNKYNSDGVLDDKELEFDFSLNEANGIQLTKYQELAMRQFANSGKPQVTLNATSPASGKDSYLLDTMGNGIFNVPGSKDGQYQPDGVVKGFTTSEATTPRGFVWDATNGKVVIRTDGTAGASTNKFDLKKFESPGYLLIQYNKSVDGTQSLNDWNSKGSVIFSYTNITQRSNGIFDIIGAKPANIIPLTSLINAINATTLHTDIIINLFFLKATAVDGISLYPYSDAPLLRKSSVTLSKPVGTTNFVAILNDYCPSPQILNGQPFTTSEDSNSPAEPFFTFHPHQNRSQIPIAAFSSTGNHRFLGALAGYAKSEAELIEEYAYQIVDSFNKEFRRRKIDATMIKGPNLAEIIIDYPSGETIEIRNRYGSHEFYPSINGTSESSSYPGYYVKLAERVNNEYEEKNQIQWSRRRIPEITTRTLYKNIGENNSSIIGIAANTDDLYVFKEDGIFRCTDSGDLNGFDLPVVSEFTFSTNLICQASGSIQEINDEIIFLSQYGFMSIVNGGVQNISGAIERDILTLLSVSPKNRIRSFVNESKNLYYCTFINESDPTLKVKSGTYIFNTKTRQWSFMDEEVLAGIEDYSNRNVVAYRQRPVKAVLQNRVMTDDGSKPIFDFTSSQVMSNNMVQRATETTPLDLFYTTREQYTNNVRNNALDQYDYISQKRYEGTNELWIKKTGTNEFCMKTEFIPRNTIFRNKFRTSIEHALVSSYDSVPALGSTVSVVDSFVTLFANRSVYLRRMNSSAEMYQIRIKSNGFDNCNMLAYYEFVDTPPSWFTAMANGYFNTNGTATYEIVVGIPVKIAFNPESGNSPDTNKLFQEYMVHTETTNKGALMSFKTDSRSAFTTDRRFVYDPAATTRNVFRTYIPTTAARGRYLIRQIKHDVPLENLIITGQTIVMRDSGSTRVQKDKDES